MQIPTVESKAAFLPCAIPRVVVREILVSQHLRGVGEQEIQLAAARLAELGRKHRGLPAVLDFFKERESYYIVLSDMEGTSLASLMHQQGGDLPERILAEYGRQLCEVLTVFSSQTPPLVHGGISPSMVIVSPDGANVSLIHIPLFSPNEFPASKLHGPPGYLAPEQTRGILIPSSDLYSVAAVLHHAVTASDPTERVAFFCPPARRLNPAVSPEMEAILARELRLNPADRYPTAAAMEKDLALLIASYPENRFPVLHLTLTRSGVILTFPRIGRVPKAEIYSIEIRKGITHGKGSKSLYSRVLEM